MSTLRLICYCFTLSIIPAFTFSGGRSHIILKKISRLHQHRPHHQNQKQPQSNEESSCNVTVTEYLLPDRRALLASITFGFGTGAVAINDNDASFVASAKSDTTGLLTTLMASPSKVDNLQSKNDTPITITLPLELSAGGTFCVRVIFTSDDDDIIEVYRAIVDTGSPYLVLPSSGSGDGDNKSGILQWIQSAYASSKDTMMPILETSYAPTEEVYGAVTGQINWKETRYMFRDDRLQIINQSTATIGVLDDALTNEATGGRMMEPFALLGLIQNNNPNRRSRFPESRPTFLEQECIISGDGGNDDKDSSEIKSFSIDGPSRELSLSTQSLLSESETNMKLVDLRTVGDFVDHYAVLVDSISFDGVSISAKDLQPIYGGIERPIVAVFDTGLTGCLLIRNFADTLQQYMGTIGKNVKVDEFISVSLTLTGEKPIQDKTKRIKSSVCIIESSVQNDARFYVQPIDLDWFDEEQYSPYIVVLGQTFLSKGKLSIDINKRRATFIKKEVID